MWKVLEHRNLNRRLGKLPIEIQKRYEKWKDIVELSGAEGLKQIRGFHDEKLSVKWQGYRSNRLSLQYRVIYQIKKKELVVHVIDLTAHDYRKNE